MTITDPIKDLQWGKGDWQDYINNWREKDAEYIQARSILRYHSAADRTIDFPSPAFGQVTYNETAVQVSPGVFVDRPEMYSKQHAKWVPLLMLANLTSTKDDATGVSLAHTLAGGKGVQFQPAQTVMDNPINAMSGVLYVDGTGVSIKTGAQTAKLTTDATGLVSDKPISAPGLITGGTLAVTGAFSAGSISTPGTATLANITMSGTLTGGIVNGTSGTIGGVGLASNVVTASGRLDSQSGTFYGDGSSAVMRQRNPSGGALGGPYVQATTDRINLGGSPNYVDCYPTFRLFGGRGIHWINAGGSHQAWISPVIVQAGDPGAGNFPDGTIWIQP